MNILALTSPRLTANTLAVIRSGAEFREMAGSVLGIIMILAFIGGVVLIIGGAMAKAEHPGGAKTAMVTGAILAGAPAIMAVFFSVFGSGDAIVDANYK